MPKAPKDASKSASFGVFFVKGVLMRYIKINIHSICIIVQFFRQDTSVRGINEILSNSYKQTRFIR